MATWRSWLPRWAPATASTGRPTSCCEHRAGIAQPVARNTWTPRSSSCARGTATPRVAGADYHRRCSTARRDNAGIAKRLPALRFLPIDNEQLIAYAKTIRRSLDNVGGDASSTSTRTTRRRGWIDISIPTALPGCRPDTYQMHDLCQRRRHFMWSGAQLREPGSPANQPAHIMALRARMKRENDFDYFLAGEMLSVNA